VKGVENRTFGRIISRWKSYSILQFLAMVSLEMTYFNKVFVALVANIGPGELSQVFDQAEMSFVKVEVQFLGVFGFRSPKYASHPVRRCLEDGYRNSKYLFEMEKVW
jgi:hypothetical protein